MHGNSSDAVAAEGVRNMEGGSIVAMDAMAYKNTSVGS